MVLVSLADESSAGAEVDPLMNATLLVIRDDEGKSLLF